MISAWYAPLAIIGAWTVGGWIGTAFARFVWPKSHRG